MDNFFKWYSMKSLYDLEPGPRVGGTERHVQRPFIGVQREHEEKTSDNTYGGCTRRLSAHERGSQQGRSYILNYRNNYKEACVHHMLGNGSVFRPLLSPRWEERKQSQSNPNRGPPEGLFRRAVQPMGCQNETMYNEVQG